MRLSPTGVLDAFRVLWRALVSLYDDSFLLLRGNLAWVLLGSPLFVVTFVLLLLFPGTAGGSTEDTSALVRTMILVGVGLFLLPSPGGVALGALARNIVYGEGSNFAAFGKALRQHWVRGLWLYAVSAIGVGVLGVNVVFYATVPSGFLQLATILWLYALLFWLCVQSYLVPLLLHLERPTVLGLYRRAALLVLGRPLFSIMLVVLLVPFSILSVVVPPVGLLAGAAFVALVHAHAFRQVRISLGDYVEPVSAENADQGWSL